MKTLLETLALGLSTMFTISAHAATALNASTVQGDYLIKAKDVYLVALVRLGATDATLTLEGDGGKLTFSGADSIPAIPFTIQKLK